MCLISFILGTLLSSFQFDLLQKMFAGTISLIFLYIAQKKSLSYFLYYINYIAAIRHHFPNLFELLVYIFCLKSSEWNRQVYI